MKNKMKSEETIMFKKKRMDYEDKTSKLGDPSSKPDKEKTELRSIGLSDKALRNLPQSSYSIQADPYTAVLPGSKPYPILSRMNKKVGGNYAGLKNLDGGNAAQYANSVQSKFLAYADFIKTKVVTNYRMLPLNIKNQPKVSETDYAGKLLVDEMRKAISESTSILSSTTFTQMPIFNYGVITDMPMGSATTTSVTVNGQTEQVYTNLPDVIYASLIFYQVVLQAGLNFFSWHNSFRLKMGQMIRRSWNRETPILNSLFGLFKKKSFLSFLDSISLSFEGEYIDLDELHQLNMLTVVPSCRSDALTDPVKELVLSINRPDKFKLVLLDGEGNGVVAFDKDVDLSVTYKTSATTTETGNYFDLIDAINDLLSAESTMKWARDPEITPSADTTRYNQVKWRVDGVQLALTKFKTKMSDIREVLDTMTRTGTINWKKGYKPTIVQDTDAEPVDNMIVNDIYRIKGSSAPKVTLDTDTKRWRTFTLWNMYDGIPEFDAYQGGAFLTLSLKQVDFSNDNDLIHQYMPIRFVASTTASDDYFYAVSRDGVEMVVENDNLVLMSTDAVLARLAPLPSQANLEIKVPKLQANDTNGVAVDTAHKSCMYKTLVQTFGLSEVTLVNNTDIAVDPDVIAIYQVELEDITNEAITYARANAPFRGTASTIDILGFSQSKISRG